MMTMTPPPLNTSSPMNMHNEIIIPISTSTTTATTPTLTTTCPNDSMTPTGDSNDSNATLNIRTVNELLSMVMSEVAAKANILDRYYSTMGVQPNERAIIFADLYKSIKAYLDSSVTEAQELIGVLEMEIGNNSREIRSIAHALEDQDAITRMELIGTNIGLYPRSHAHATILQSLQERKQERLGSIEAAQTKIQQYYNELGVPEQDRLIDNNPKDLSIRRIQTLNAEVQRLLVTKQQSIQEMKDLVGEILFVCEELGVSPDELTLEVAQLNPANPDDEAHKGLVGVEVFKALCGRRDILFAERSKRCDGIKHYKQLITELWNRLEIDDEHRAQFLASVGDKITSSAADLWKTEYDDILRTKAVRMEQLILQVRTEIKELYTQLKYTPEQRAQFAALFSNIYDDACLQAHEDEKARLEGILSSSRLLLEKVEKREKFRADYAEYLLNINDQSRFHVRGAHLILQREEAIRKQALRFPAQEEQLRNKIMEWEVTYNQEFLVEGERYLDKMEREARDDNERAEARRRMVQEQKEQRLEERMSVFGQRPTGPRAAPVAPVSGGRSSPRVGGNPARVPTPSNVVTPSRSGAAVRRNILGDGDVGENRGARAVPIPSAPAFITDKLADDPSSFNRNAAIARTTPIPPNGRSQTRRVANKENHGTL